MKVICVCSHYSIINLLVFTGGPNRERPVGERRIILARFEDRFLFQLHQSALENYKEKMTQIILLLNYGITECNVSNKHSSTSNRCILICFYLNILILQYRYVLHL